MKKIYAIIFAMFLVGCSWVEIKTDTYQYLRNIVIWVDEGGSTVTGGDPGETISSRLGKAQRDGNKFADVFCTYFLNQFVANHCQDSIEQYEGSRAILKN